MGVELGWGAVATLLATFYADRCGHRAALPSVLQQSGVAELSAFRASVAVAAALSFLPVLAYWRLSSSVEAPRVASARRVSPETRSILWKISSLFALDSLAGGFLTTALLSFFFHERFGGTRAYLIECTGIIWRRS